MSPLRRFILAIGLIVALIAIGTAGFQLIEGWSYQESLYMAFVTISTVGFEEIHPLTTNGRTFMIFYISISVITIGFTLTTLISFLFEGQILETMKERKMSRLIANLKDHYILCGFGNVGRETALEFQKKGVKFVIIEANLDDSDRDRFPKMNFLIGDATEEEFLISAGIKKAKGLLTCLPDDQKNLFVVLTARQLNSNLHIVTESSSISSVKKLEIAGADRVVTAKKIAGQRMAALSLQPSIVSFLELLSTGDDHSMRIESVSIGKHSPLIDNSLKSSKLGNHTGAIIIGVLDPNGNARVNQSELSNLATLILKEDDELIVLGNDAQISSLIKFNKG